MAKKQPGLEVIALGRPELDLSEPGMLASAVRAARPDVLVNAAAYTAVDKAEEEEALATIINGEAAGVLAKATANLDVPVIQISTDYVFDGTKSVPYVETDPVAPVNAYGRSKLAGERVVAGANTRHVILRTSWVYDGSGKNFLTTMLRLARTREELGVVADQIGSPSYAPDIADAIVQVARNLLAGRCDEHHGTFHMTGSGDTSWADFASEIFRISAANGGPSARVRGISTDEYPTPAKRPANSRLNCDRLATVHGVRLPGWQDALTRCMNEMTGKAE
jgi:dTDP-4-dehydrorhamnose reductase